MPDWCENKLYITGDDHAVSLFCQSIEGESKQMFKKVAPQNKRSKGKCVYWNEQKGYGFIKSEESFSVYDPFDDENDYGDIFVHCSDIHANGKQILREDEHVEFDTIVQRDGRKKAVRVTGPNGRYVDGNYDWLDHKATHQVKIQCYGLECIYSSIDQTKSNQSDTVNHHKSTSDKPQLTNSSKNVLTNGAIYTFSTKFSPPRGWLSSAARAYAKYDISLRLMYQTENEVCFGRIVYEKGKCLDNYNVTAYELITGDAEAFESVLRDEIQEIFNKAVRECLKAYDIGPNLQKTLLGFCPQYLLKGVLLNEFNAIWNGYENDKNYKVSDSSALYGLFNGIDNAMEAILAEDGVEITDRFWVRYHFWGRDYGLFKRIFEDAFE